MKNEHAPESDRPTPTSPAYGLLRDIIREGMQISEEWLRDHQGIKVERLDALLERIGRREAGARGDLMDELRRLRRLEEVVEEIERRRPDTMAILFAEAEEALRSGPHCAECGERFLLTEEGVAHHLDPDDEINYDLDRDHVPYMDVDLA